MTQSADSAHVIAVTGGTGNIGRHVLTELAQTEASVRVLARDPSRLPEQHQTRFDIVAADLDEPATLGPALAGVDRLFILSPGPDVPAQDAALIKAAVDAGVRHVVMVSSLGAELGGIAGGRPHLPGEALLKESGLDWTLLHPSEFMTNTAWWRDTILSAGSIFVPTGTGRVGFVDPADIGAVAAKVLTTDGHDGQTYRITGPEALSTADIAAVLSEVLGRPVAHVDVPPEAFRSGMEQAGLPPFLIDMQVEYCAAVANGVVDIVSPDVPNLLGRPATDYRAWAHSHADVFAPGDCGREVSLMQAVELGKTGIVVAPLGVGAMPWGSKRALAYGGAESDDAEQEALGALLEAGVTLVDTAEMYRNEERIGALVGGHKEVVLATKYAPFPWRRRSSVLAALNRSLGRLKVDHVDLYQVHMPPRTMSMHTLMGELVKAHRDGKVLAIGVSNFDEKRLRSAHAELAREGIALASNQVQYSLLHRKPEVDGVLDTCAELGVTLIAYMPLASGALTGKYDASNKPGGIRRVLPSFRGSNFEALPPVIELLTKIGKAHDASPSQVALRWLIQRGAVPIPGAKNAAQARSNAGALAISLSDSEMAELDEATRAWRK